MPDDPQMAGFNWPASGIIWILLAFNITGLVHQIIIGAPDHLLLGIQVFVVVGLGLRTCWLVGRAAVKLVADRRSAL